MKVAGWRFWYTHNRVFDSKNTKWEDLPESGALYLVIYYEELPYRQIINGGDWYWKDGCCTYGCSSSTLCIDYWIDPPLLPKNILKRGVWVTDEEIEKIRQEAYDSKWL